MLIDWLKFCSGSDIRGVALEGTGRPIDLTDEAVYQIAQAFCYFLKNKTGKESLKISIGRDSRLSGERIEKAIILACCDSGVDVIKCGLSSTPAMFMTVVDDAVKADGAIQITASHHPFDKNGLKFFDIGGGLEHNDIITLLTYAHEKRKINLKGGNVSGCDYMKIYCDKLVSMVQNGAKNDIPLKGLKIIVDAGNGVGGFYEKILQRLGADTSGSQFLQPDGRFPNHVPNPEDSEAMKSIVSAVKGNNADYGIIFDTDVDRAGMVDKNGNEINRNVLIAVISKILLNSSPNATIVTDSITSTGLNKFIINNGGFHHRFKRGYKNVINEAIRLNKEGIYTPLAIETSGHAAFKENYFLDDGAYLVTRILIEVARLNLEGKNLMSMICDLEMPIESDEIRLTFYEENFKEYGNKIISEIIDDVKKSSECYLADSNYEGVRAEFPNGWFLLRISVHDPIMPINIESNKLGNNKQIAKWLYDRLKRYRGINSKKLCEYISN